MCQSMEELYNEGMKNGIEIGEKRGKEIGKEIGTRNMVREMIKSGKLTLESIALISGFSIEKLKEIETEQYL